MTVMIIFVTVAGLGAILICLFTEWKVRKEETGEKTEAKHWEYISH